MARFSNLQLNLLHVDILLDLSPQYLEEELAVSVPAVLPASIQQVVPSLQPCTTSVACIRCMGQYCRA